ncbi:cytoplasmic dynein 1 light intermediate chain 1 [Striga asiatica]|uniref:Cytoplasmic dynein 1 light intermediate chain 1 n=1 Tax=Striga asiatica TaxID=4170 RepID=A0A5A7RKZ7_STRAF|nr:cytoplasmic dynein 1 light intermediate chain 1 [Striga asiatica]
MVIVEEEIVAGLLSENWFARIGRSERTRQPPHPHRCHTSRPRGTPVRREILFHSCEQIRNELLSSAAHLFLTNNRWPFVCRRRFKSRGDHEKPFHSEKQRSFVPHVGSSYVCWRREIAAEPCRPFTYEQQSLTARRPSSIAAAPRRPSSRARTAAAALTGPVEGINRPIPTGENRPFAREILKLRKLGLIKPLSIGKRL